MMADPMLRRAEKYENIVKTDDASTCPRCESTDVAWCGGDMDGYGGYYHMYLCEDCGRLPEAGVQVFLVPCSEEDYGHDPLAPPRDPYAVLSMAYKEMERPEPQKLTCAEYTPDAIILSEADREELLELTKKAQTTPVILLGGVVDVSREAWNRVREKWKELGAEYGFVPESVKGIDPETGEVQLKEAS